MPADNVAFRLLPPRDAVEYFRGKGDLRPSFSWQDLWEDEHTRAFTVAGMLRTDLLVAVRDAVDRAIAGGTSLADFQRALTPLLQREGWWGRRRITDPETGETRVARLGSPARLKLIYEVNVRQAYAAGRWARIERGRRVAPIILYRTMRDERVRLAHRAWDGIALPIDHPWWDTHFPPNGWNCRCIGIGTTEADLARREAAGARIRREAPPIQYRAFRNRRTLQTVRVPAGIDPGFAYNPGKRRAAALHQALAEKLDAAPPDIAAAAVTAWAGSRAFARFFERPEGEVPIGRLSAAHAEALGARAAIVRLSAQTMAKQKRTHPEILAPEYAQVQRTIEAGEAIRDGPRSIIFVLEQAGYVSVVKATRTGAAVFLTSFRRLSSDAVKRERDLRRLRQRGKREEG